MPNIPAAGDLEDNLILAQRVELLVSTTATSTGTAGDKFTAMRELSLEIVHPESRINHGLKRTYGHGAPDIGIRFTLSVTKDVLDYLRTRGVRNSAGIIPIYRWAMKVTSNDATVKIITVNGKLTEKQYSKEDAGQGDAIDVECLVRVTDDAEPATTAT